MTPRIPGLPTTIDFMTQEIARPAAKFTPHIHREWVPTCLLMIHDEKRSTSIRFAPLHVSRDQGVTYEAVFKVFGEDPLEPIWEAQSPAMGLTDLFCVESTQVAEATGRKRLFSYVEEYSRVRERGPQNAIISLNSQAQYNSTDGSLHGHLGSFYIFGSPRKMLKGQYYYENFPGAKIGSGHAARVYCLNPFTRSSGFWVLVVDAEGRTYESPRLEVGGKQAAEWKSEDMDLGDVPQPCGLIVRSELKLGSIFAAVDSSGRMVSFEHGHAFLSQVLKH